MVSVAPVVKVTVRHGARARHPLVLTSLALGAFAAPRRRAIRPARAVVLKPEEVGMRRTIIAIAAASLLASLAASCVSGPKAPEMTAVVQVQPEAPKKPEPVRKERNEEYKVPVPIKETVTFSDGVLDRVITYEYSDGYKAILSSTAMRPSTPDPLERVTYEYKNGMVAVKSTFGADGTLSGKVEYTYGPKGELIGELISDAKGSVQSSSEWIWEGGKKASWIVKSQTGSVLARTDYTYSGTALASAALMDGAGNAKGRIEYSYGSDGMPSVTRYFNAAGGSDGRVEYTVKDGKTLTESVYKADGRMERKIAYEYGSDGALVKKVLYDASGRAREVVAFENAYRVETRVIVYYE